MHIFRNLPTIMKVELADRSQEVPMPTRPSIFEQQAIRPTVVSEILSL